MTDLDLKLQDLDIYNDFIRRHIGPGPIDTDLIDKPSTSCLECRRGVNTAPRARDSLCIRGSQRYSPRDAGPPIRPCDP